MSKEKQMSKVSIASIVVALGLCASGSALAAPAADGADWAKAQIGEDSGSFYLSQQRWLSARTRAELRQEVVAAQRGGDADVLHGEDSGSFYLSRAAAREAVPYAGIECGLDAAPRAALQAAPAAR
jgi:hypothetical protein